MTTLTRDQRSTAIFEPGAGHATPTTIGAKAAGLLSIADAGLSTPPWFAVLPGFVASDGAVSESTRVEIASACARLAARGAESYAVRSSAGDEDAPGRSFAGQYLTTLDVRGVDAVLDAIAASARWSERGGVDAYRAAHGSVPGPAPVAIIVQAYVHPAAAGVAFSREPVTGADEVVITASRLADGHLSIGETTGDEYRVLPDDRVVVRPAGSAESRPVNEPPIARVLSDDQARALARVARLLDERQGWPQDVEWLYSGADELLILQSRPITALPKTRAAGGPIRLWDDANIVESFPEQTLPLTFSIAVGVYATVYRRACLALGVSRRVVDRETDVFEGMLGLLQGRVFYNLSSWYRVLALLPGFRLTAGFLEAMMGARRPGSEPSERSIPVAAGVARSWEIARMTMRLSYRWLRIEQDVERFKSTIHGLLERHRAVHSATAPSDELLAEFERLRDDALRSWSVPILNDLFLMLANGALRRVAERWLGPDSQALVTRLLVSGAVASARPGEELLQIAAAIRERDEWRNAVVSTPPELLRSRLASEPDLGGAAALVEAYIRQWGDRAPRELQLDRPSYTDDPTPLLRALRILVTDSPERHGESTAEAEAKVRGELLAGRRGAVRLATFNRLLRATRRHIRWREELRALRGQVFGVGRRIFRQIGEALRDEGVLERAEDVHYLTLDELRGLVRGTGAIGNPRSLVRLRRDRYEDYATLPRLPSRFETRGSLTDPLAIEPLTPSTARTDGPAVWRGIGAASGRVRAACLVVRDPVSADLLPGRIIVARSTDPGWVPILVGAAGLLVEQGSLLSHSAIVARELGLPTVVGLAGLLDAVRTGDILALDGSSGEVTLVARPTGVA